MSDAAQNVDRKRHRPYNVADGFGVYKYARARTKLEFDTNATTALAAARSVSHSVAENTTLHGVKRLRRAKGITAYAYLIMTTVVTGWL